MGLLMALTSALYSSLIFPSSVWAYFSSDRFSFILVDFSIWREVNLCNQLQRQIHQVAPKKRRRHLPERVSRKTELALVEGLVICSASGHCPSAQILADDVTHKSNPQTKLESDSAFANPYKIESGFWVKIFGSSGFL